jgi:hypothetical protein
VLYCLKLQRSLYLQKPGDDLPTAGGYGVMICYDEEDLAKATQRILEASDAYPPAVGKSSPGLITKGKSHSFMRALKSFIDTISRSGKYL